MTAPLNPAEIAALAERATPGPWDVHRLGGVLEGRATLVRAVTKPRAAVLSLIDALAIHDAALIVHLRNSVPSILALAARAERLEAVARAAREVSDARKESVRVTETVPFDDFGPGFIAHADCLKRSMAALDALDAALADLGEGAGA